MDVANRLREYFLLTGTNEVNLRDGYSAFLTAAGEIFVHKDGGSVELSLIDDSTKNMIKNSLPSVDIKDTKKFRELSSELPDDIVNSPEYKKLSV